MPGIPSHGPFPEGTTKPLGLFLAAAGLLFLVLCLAGIHGFSLPAWHQVIDGSPPAEVLIGQARFIRADDWAVHLPLALSQDRQEPPFPVYNALVGEGRVDNRVGYPVAIHHWLTIFRPQTWGFFFGRDFGLAWCWWFRSLGLLVAFVLAFSLLARGRFWLPLFAGLALLFSPFFQYWSLNFEPLAAMAALSFVAFAGVVLATTRRAMFGYGGLLVWSAGCFALSTIYPPFQITLAYWSLFLLGGFWLREHSRIAAAPWRRLRWITLIGAGLFVVSAILFYVQGSRETITAVLNTAYPGHRVATGGDVSLGQLFGSFFTAFRSEEAFIPFGNICEGAGFFSFFPLIGVFLIWELVARRRSPDPVLAASALYALLFAVYAWIGIPSWLARMTGMSLVPGVRTILGQGLAGMVLLVCVLAPREKEMPPNWTVSAFLAAIWTLVLAGLAFQYQETLPEMSWGGLLLAVAAAGALGLALLRGWRHAVLVVAALTIASTIWFNPLVRGGSRYLEENPVSKMVLEVNRRAGGNPRWVVFNDVWLSNLLRAIGVRAVGGVHYSPQFALWNRLDPQGNHRDIWNRYSHVVFGLKAEEGSIDIQLPVADRVVVRVLPSPPMLRRLGADFILYTGPDPGPLEARAGLRRIASWGDKYVLAPRN